MAFPEQRTLDSVFLWLIHRIAEVFGEKAILKGGMELRLFDLPRFTNDLDYVFVPFSSKKEIDTLLDGIMAEIPDAVVTKGMHSKMLRYRIETGGIAVQLEAGVADNCPSMTVSTAALSGKVKQLARLIRVMRLDTALAHKLAAWNERRLARDLYDVYCLHTLLGETPDRATLQERLTRIESRLPALRRKKSMTLRELAGMLRIEADGLADGKLQPLQSLLDQTASIGLEKKIRVALHSLANILDTW